MSDKEDNYKKDVDFEMREVKGKDGKVLHTTRHFFTKAEKEASKKPVAATKPPAKPSTAPKAKDTAKPKTDNTAEVVRKASAAIDRATTVKKQPTRPITATPVKMPSRPKSPTPPSLSFVTAAEWYGMSRTERGKKGLPTSWVDYVKAGGDAVVKKPKLIVPVAKAPNRMEAFKLQQKKK
jgi:hypothetical protein